MSEMSKVRAEFAAKVPEIFGKSFEAKGASFHSKDGSDLSIAKRWPDGQPCLDGTVSWQYRARAAKLAKALGVPNNVIAIRPCKD